jgi:hypothetical protein
MQSTAEQIHHFLDQYDESNLETIQTQAADGIAQAQFELGLLYSHGKSVSIDTAEAATWLQKAAENNHMAAMTLLAWMYVHGEGVNEDASVAMNWYQKAAEMNDADAQCALADLYHDGKPGIEQNLNAMLHWYERSANAGHAKAQYMLGTMMAQGKLIQQNDEAAFQWLTLAVLNESEAAKQELAMLTARLDKESIEAYKARMISMVGSTH